MKKTILLVLLLLYNLQGKTQVNNQTETFSLLTWNIQDMGRTKSNSELNQIAEIVNQFDLIAIQEVVAKDPAGAQSVAKLANMLNRKGSKWEYKISHPTKSSSSYRSERYAYLWKASKFRLYKGSPYLKKELELFCEREPFILHLKTTQGKEINLVNFHSVPHNQQPELEVQYLSTFFTTKGTILMGDFNLKETHNVWNAFYKQGAQPAVYKTPTTLKRKCASGNYLNHSIDNIFFDNNTYQLIEANHIDYIKNCKNLSQARMLSDHLPIYAILEVR